MATQYVPNGTSLHSVIGISTKHHAGISAKAGLKSGQVHAGEQFGHTVGGHGHRASALSYRAVDPRHIEYAATNRDGYHPADIGSRNVLPRLCILESERYLQIVAIVGDMIHLGDLDLLLKQRLAGHNGQIDSVSMAVFNPLIPVSAATEKRVVKREEFAYFSRV